MILIISMPPKRILYVDLSYEPKCTEFFLWILENRTCFKYSPNKFFFIERGPNWRMLALHEVFENQALTRGFLLYVYREGKLFEPIKST